MSAIPAPTGRELIARLAEVIHHGSAGQPGSALVVVSLRESDLDLGLWPIPAAVDHPADVLLGCIAPAHYDLIGLVSHGWATRLPGTADDEPWLFDIAEGSRLSTRITVLTARDGTTQSVIEPHGQQRAVIEDQPHGWVSDSLARALGRGTPPPVEPLSACVEEAWLHTIAETSFGAPDAVRAWEDIARLHPLAPPGRVLAGPQLGLEVRALDATSSWHRIRQLFGHDTDRLCSVHPPDWARVPLHQWFDDGSFARWSRRNRVPAEELLADLLDVLPPSVGEELIDALVSVSPTSGGSGLDSINATEGVDPWDEECPACGSAEGHDDTCSLVHPEANRRWLREVGCPQDPSDL